MKKTDLLKYFLALGCETTTTIAEKLGYAHRNSIQRLPATIKPRTVLNIIDRMKARRIKVPKEWI